MRAAKGLTCLRSRWSERWRRTIWGENAETRRRRIVGPSLRASVHAAAAIERDASSVTIATMTAASACTVNATNAGAPNIAAKGRG